MRGKLVEFEIAYAPSVSIEDRFDSLCRLSGVPKDAREENEVEDLKKLRKYVRDVLRNEHYSGN